jgi:hypothetical protein
MLKIHQENFDTELFETITKRHITECAKIVRNGKLVLVLKDKFAVAARHDVTLSEDMSLIQTTRLYSLLKGSMQISPHYRTPTFYKITHSNDTWYFNIATHSAEQSQELLEKRNRTKLRGYGSINWFFPGTIATKVMLNKMRRLQLIHGWHLSRKAARIVLELGGEDYYTIRNSTEISGLLAIANNRQHLKEIIGTQKIVYNRDMLIKRNEALLRNIEEEEEEY